MNKFTIIVAVLLLAGCANSQQLVSDAAAQCPPVGINIKAPDFEQAHSKAEVESFYSCMETQLRPSGLPNIGHPGTVGYKLINGADDIKTGLITDLEYQKSLWAQVISKEKTPPSAEQAWLQWQQESEQAKQLIEAAQDQANAARRAAAAAQDAAMAQQSAATAAAIRPPMTCMANGPFLNCQ